MYIHILHTSKTVNKKYVETISIQPCTIASEACKKCAQYQIIQTWSDIIHILRKTSQWQLQM